MAQLVSNQIKRFSTAQQDARHRTDWWSEMICKTHFKVDFYNKNKGPYQGFLDTIRANRFELTDIRAANASTQRTRQNMREDTTSNYMLLFPVFNGFSVTQFQNQADCVEKTFTLLDSSEPFSFQQHGEARTVTLQIPRNIIDERITDPQAICGRPIRADNGMPKLAYDFMLGLLEEKDQISVEELAVTCQQLIDLVALSLRSESAHLSSETSVRIANLRRLKRYIEQHLADYTLTPPEVAAKCGVSVRYLHNLFHDMGKTFGQYVRAERLKHSRAMLENPLHHHRSITEIAFACGFSNSGHFSGSFKAEYGISPSDARASTIAK